MKNSLQIKKMTIAIVFLAIGWLLPFLTMQIPEIGNMLCPMHIPILICGLILGPWYGFMIGFITPLTRTLLFGMPILYPTSIAMAFELGTYGFVSGIIYLGLNKTNINNKYFKLYLTLILSMLSGRIVYGISRYLTGLFGSSSFTFKLFITDSVLNAWPGIIIQLTFIPLIVSIMAKSEYIKTISYFSFEFRIEEVINHIKKLIKEKGKIIISIDGMAGSGKTTLANKIAKIFKGRVIHIDDFYLPFELRTEERMNQIGGNINYEKFIEDVVNNLSDDISYQPYDCKKKKYKNNIYLPLTNLTIIEGTYSLHPQFNVNYDLVIFLMLDEKKQKERIIKRGSEEQYKVFLNLWIPKENKYLSTIDMINKSNYIINVK